MCIVQILLCGKAVAAGLSGSLSVITSVIDSGVDVMSGVLMWWSSRAVKKRNPYCYPQGIFWDMGCGTSQNVFHVLSQQM